jgi:hypothetical protein
MSPWARQPSSKNSQKARLRSRCSRMCDQSRRISSRERKRQTLGYRASAMIQPCHWARASASEQRSLSRNSASVTFTSHAKYGLSGTGRVYPEHPPVSVVILWRLYARMATPCFSLMLWPMTFWMRGRSTSPMQARLMIARYAGVGSASPGMSSVSQSTLPNLRIQ